MMRSILESQMPTAVQVSLCPLPDRQTLATWWHELESKADLSFFTSWTWINAWLELLPDPGAARAVIAMRGDERVGLGIVVESEARLLKAFKVRAWRLHTAGVFELDDLSIEYNDFLLDRRTADEVRVAMLDWLVLHAPKGVLEIQRASTHIRRLAEHAPPRMVTRHEPLTSYLVSLNDARDGDGGYLRLISSNVRAQIRRSLKAYAAKGSISVEAATSASHALEYLEELRAMHDRRWSGRGVESGFARDPMARQFHEVLIRHGFPRGEVQMLRIRVGEADLGYLYNFIYRGTISYYQSGLNFDLIEKHGRPGLVCHALAIEHNMKLGHAWYDLLAGDYRYKASLATHLEPQAHCVFSRETPLARIDAYARRIVNARRQRNSALATVEPADERAET
jgi:CelD/BcsL family acetyltransferase involved in cellulose biosynthesis